MDVEGQQAESAGGESATTCCAVGSLGEGEGEGGGRAAALEQSGEYGRQREEEQLVYPWVGLLARAGDCAPSEAALRATFSEFNPRRIVIFEAREEASPVAALLFDKNLEGYQDGFAFDRCFLEKGRQKKAWNRTRGEGFGFDVGSHFFGWLAGQEDFYKEDEVGNFLFQHGELKTVAMVVEEQFAKHERRLEFLSATTAKKQEMLAQELAASMAKQKEVVQALQADLDKKNEELRGLRADSARQILQATQSLEADLQKKDVELRVVRADTARQVLQATQSLEADLEKKNEELEEIRLGSARTILQAKQSLEADLEKKKEEMEELRLESARKILQATQSLEENLEKKNEELEQFKVDSSRKILQATQMLDTKLEELKTLKAAIASLQSELQQKDEKLTDLEADTASLNGRLQMKDEELTALEADSASLNTRLQMKDEQLATLEAEYTSLQMNLRKKDEEIAALKADYERERMLTTEGLEAALDKKNAEVGASNENFARQVMEVRQELEKEAEELRLQLKKKSEVLEALEASRPDIRGETLDALSDRAELVWSIDALKKEIERIKKEKQAINTQLEEALQKQAEQEAQVQKLTAEVEERAEEVQTVARASVKQALEFVLIQSRHDKQLRDFGQRLAGKCRELESLKGELSSQREQALREQTEMLSEAESSSQALYVELMLWARELTERGVTIESLNRKLEEKRRENLALKAELDRRKPFPQKHRQSTDAISKGPLHIVPLPIPRHGGSKHQKARQKTGGVSRAKKPDVLPSKFEMDRSKSPGSHLRNCTGKSKDRSNHHSREGAEPEGTKTQEPSAKKIKRSVSAPVGLQWKVGELVFIDAEGHHKWPAVVQDKHDSPSQPGEVHVLMCGSDKLLVLNDEQVFKFTANDRLLLLNAFQSNPIYKAAVDQACALWDQQQQEIHRNRPVQDGRNSLPSRLTISPAKLKVLKG